MIEIIPGAGILGGSQQPARARLRRACLRRFGRPHLQHGGPQAAATLRRARPARSKPALMLPRLVGSGAELDACARSWHGERVLLKGAAASRADLTEQLRRNPAVVHLATHVLESSERPSYGLIALSLTARRESELLPPFEIAGWRTNAGLVVSERLSFRPGRRTAGHRAARPHAGLADGWRTLGDWQQLGHAR